MRGCYLDPEPAANVFPRYFTRLRGMMSLFIVDAALTLVHAPNTAKGDSFIFAFDVVFVAGDDNELGPCISTVFGGDMYTHVDEKLKCCICH